MCAWTKDWCDEGAVAPTASGDGRLWVRPGPPRATARLLQGPRPQPCGGRGPGSREKGSLEVVPETQPHPRTRDCGDGLLARDVGHSFRRLAVAVATGAPAWRGAGGGAPAGPRAARSRGSCRPAPAAPEGRAVSARWGPASLSSQWKWQRPPPSRGLRDSTEPGSGRQTGGTAIAAQNTRLFPVAPGGRRVKAGRGRAHAAPRAGVPSAPTAGRGRPELPGPWSGCQTEHVHRVVPGCHPQPPALPTETPRRPPAPRGRAPRGCKAQALGGRGADSDPWPCAAGKGRGHLRPGGAPGTLSLHVPLNRPALSASQAGSVSVTLGLAVQWPSAPLHRGGGGPEAGRPAGGCGGRGGQAPAKPAGKELPVCGPLCSLRCGGPGGVRGHQSGCWAVPCTTVGARAAVTRSLCR